MSDRESVRPMAQAASLPASYESGDPIMAKDLNLIVDGIRTNSIIASTNGIFGWPSMQSRIMAQNTSGGTIDIAQLVELDGIVTGDNSKIFPTFDTPTADNLEFVGITDQRIDDGYAGWVYIYGACLVQGLDVAVGDRLGSTNGSTVVQAQDDGPLINLGEKVYGGVTYNAVLFAPGAGSSSTIGSLVKAQEDMTVDGIAYEVKYCNATGVVVGVAFDVYRPPGIIILTDEYAFIGKTNPASLYPVLIPCNSSGKIGTLIKAQEDMTANEVQYDVKYCGNDGVVVGSSFKVYRAPDLMIRNGSYGILGKTDPESLLFTFIPCHLRDDPGNFLSVYVNATGIAGGEPAGRMCLRELP